MLRSGLATVVAGTLATVVTTRSIPLMPSGQDDRQPLDQGLKVRILAGQVHHHRPYVVLRTAQGLLRPVMGGAPWRLEVPLPFW